MSRVATIMIFSVDPIVTISDLQLGCNKSEHSNLNFNILHIQKRKYDNTGRQPRVQPSTC